MRKLETSAAAAAASLAATAASISSAATTTTTSVAIQTDIDNVFRTVKKSKPNSDEAVVTATTNDDNELYNVDELLGYLDDTTESGGGVRNGEPFSPVFGEPSNGSICLFDDSEAAPPVGKSINYTPANKNTIFGRSVLTDSESAVRSVASKTKISPSDERNGGSKKKPSLLPSDDLNCSANDSGWLVKQTPVMKNARNVAKNISSLKPIENISLLSSSPGNDDDLLSKYLRQSTMSQHFVASEEINSRLRRRRPKNRGSSSSVRNSGIKPPEPAPAPSSITTDTVIPKLRFWIDDDDEENEENSPPLQPGPPAPPSTRTEPPAPASESESSVTFKRPKSPIIIIDLDETRLPGNATNNRMTSTQIRSTAAKPLATSFRGDGQTCEYSDIHSNHGNEQTAPVLLNGSIDPAIHLSEFTEIDKYYNPDDCDDREDCEESQCILEVGVEAYNNRHRDDIISGNHNDDCENSEDFQISLTAKSVTFPAAENYIDTVARLPPIVDDVNDEVEFESTFRPRKRKTRLRKSSKLDKSSRTSITTSTPAGSNRSDDDEQTDLTMFCGTCKKTTQVESIEQEEEVEEEEEEEEEGIADDSLVADEQTFMSSFDRVPKQKSSPDFAHVAVERNRSKRRKLQAHCCKECQSYFADLPDAEREAALKRGSRHRAKYSRPQTPEHYWSLDIHVPPTQKSQGKCTKEKQRRRPRRKNPLKLPENIGSDEEGGS
ncbi:uncharacterized protein LOC141910402 [Tubulanus polymorphus]|uniref:uncharacterized protein LOC141910402 n=1 Tax=Tubulanus polymorphus TaxID=672921 RepID=UPI003DA2313E